MHAAHGTCKWSCKFPFQAGIVNKCLSFSESLMGEEKVLRTSNLIHGGDIEHIQTASPDRLFPFMAYALLHYRRFLSCCYLKLWVFDNVWVIFFHKIMCHNCAYFGWLQKQTSYVTVICWPGKLQGNVHSRPWIYFYRQTQYLILRSNKTQSYQLLCSLKHRNRTLGNIDRFHLLQPFIKGPVLITALYAPSRHFALCMWL